MALCGQTPSAPVALPAAPSLASILSAHLDAIRSLQVHDVKRYEITGTLTGLGTTGTFHTWSDGDRERHDDVLGIRTQRELRLRDRLYVQNDSGDVRQLTGLSSRRQTTEDYIDSSDFARNPKTVTFIGPAKLYDGRDVWSLRVAPPNGEPYTIGIDAHDYLVDEKSYVDGDSLETIDYDDYRVVDGLLVAYKEVDSSGDRAFDLTSTVTGVVVGQPIPETVFAPFEAVAIDVATPVRVPLREYAGLIFVDASIRGIHGTFIVDSAAQGIVLDPRMAKRLGLVPHGELQIRGAGRTSANGVVQLDGIDIGSAHLPIGVASVVDLSKIVDNGITIDGILGYPFFAASDVRIDPDHSQMTIGKPGMLGALGTKIDLDTDRELPEIHAKLNGTDGRFFVDTADSSELLVFRNFLDAHPGLLPYAGRNQVENRGVGGSNVALAVLVNELDIGDLRLFNRAANVVLASGGAFADRNDAGNIGYGSLKNFVMTFDLAEHALYLQKAARFDDGRYRPVYDDKPPLPPRQ